MSTMQTEERIGEAWKQHRMGNNESAIDIFRDVLIKVPGDLDALYGFGLAQRANGDIDGAAESFNKALQLAQEALDAGGYSTTNDLNSDEDDRLLMLQKMISQRLEELEIVE